MGLSSCRHTAQHQYGPDAAPVPLCLTSPQYQTGKPPYQCVQILSSDILDFCKARNGLLVGEAAVNQ